MNSGMNSGMNLIGLAALFMHSFLSFVVVCSGFLFSESII
jgi:hypothetical protein